MPNFNLMDPPAEDTGEEQSPGQGNGQIPPVDLSYLFAAPDLSKFVKPPRSAVAKEYEGKTAALLKAGMVGAINAQQFPDAAAFIYYGPGVSAAAGALADADERAKKVLDFLTAPANPYILFAVTVLPMVSQLFRNHEREIAAVPENFRTRKQRRAARKAEDENSPRVVLHLPFGKQIKLGIRARFPVGRIFSAFRTQTADPRDLTVKVFSDPKIIDALRKQGINIPSGG